MDPTIPLKSALSALLSRQVQAGPDAPEQAHTEQALPQQATAPALGAVLLDFFRASSNLGVLGLHRPRNAGDVEAILAQLSLTLDRLASDNDGAKGIARAAQRRNVLSELNAGYASAEGLRLAVADKSRQLDEVTATRDAMSGDLSVLEARAGALAQAIPGLEGDEQAHAMEELAAVNATISDVAAVIAGLNGDIDTLAAEIAGLNGALSLLTVFADFLADFVLKTTSREDGTRVDDAQDHASRIQQEDTAGEILPLLEEIFEIRLEDEAVREVIVDNDLSENEVRETVERAIGLAATVSAAIETLLLSSDLVAFDPNAVAGATGKAGRLQISL